MSLTNYNIAIEAAEKLSELAHDFEESKSKEVSKKIRDLLNRISKVSKPARQELIKLDKEL